jgi:hypothetical protein
MKIREMKIRITHARRLTHTHTHAHTHDTHTADRKCVEHHQQVREAILAAHLLIT